MRREVQLVLLCRVDMVVCISTRRIGVLRGMKEPTGQLVAEIQPFFSTVVCPCHSSAVAFADF